jgi:methylglutaconyl-CoA hydratase
MGEMIDAKAAHRIGLVHRVVPGDELIPAGKAFASPLLKGGPRALASVKEMLSALPQMAPDEAAQYTAKLIAGLRAGEEGQEGMGAFLEKRKPKWSTR